MVDVELSELNEYTMSRILAVSDIHIHDYPQRNPSEKYRLYQGRTVCQNIIKAGHAEGCDIIVIAGDLIEKFLIRPYVQAEVKAFLDTLMREFREGYIIWGNHDQENKGIYSEFTDSCLSVMLPPNLHYADMKEVVIDGCRIGFYNWRPEFDLSWVSGKLDVLFTHATICYSPEDNYHSQELDESKFDLAICGDIHKPAQNGKYVSIGIPQRCKMSDSDVSSGVVLDPGTKSWKWVNLNQEDNLMKFKYTTIREEEGWDQGTGTWNVYKPSNQSISGGVKDIKIPAWEEIGHLTDNIIVANNLQGVHSEVLQNLRDIDSKEVDFNFVITRFYCKNWRSIDEVELFFGDMDKVLITGQNGSGKSSLLSAIKYAFLENPHPKDLIQFGTKECWTEVEFLYQGSQYKIQRGSKKYGFWINGEPQKYNGKKDFEKDMHLRFPFIDYMDVYFFDSDHPKLIGDITPERKSEIISRFYKMDRIDAYNDQAKILLEQYMRQGNGWREEMNKTQELLSYVEGKLQLMTLPTLGVDDLKRKRDVGKIMQEKWIAYNRYMTTTANLQAQKASIQEQLQGVQEKIQGYPDLSQVDGKIQTIQGSIDWITEKNRALTEIKSEGRRLFFERQDLDKKKTCPSCGQAIKSGDHLEQHKAELDQKINALVEKQNLVYQEFWNFGIQDKAEIDSGCRNTLNQYNSEVSLELSKKNDYRGLLRQEQELQGRLGQVEQTLLGVGPQPEKVELPANFMEEMGKIETDLSTWQQYDSLISDREQALTSIQRCQKEMDMMSQAVDAYQAYIKLTGPTGMIYKEIMTKLAEQFSDNRIRYEVVQSTFRGKDHLNLESSYILNGNEVRYVNCSDGQRTLLDVDFLSKVVTRMGLLIMDEFLKHLDAANHDVVLDMIGQMNIGLILISSHMESIPAFNNKSLRLELNESGITKITMK